MLYDVLMNINPVAFRIGNLEVRWYGLIITCAMVLGLIILIFMAKKKGISCDIICKKCGVYCLLYFTYKGDVLNGK